MVSESAADGIFSGQPENNIFSDGMISFAFSERGSSHIASDKPCQDSSLIKTTKNMVFISTADGHGGDDYIRSGVGSGMCCRAAYECMTDDTFLSALTAARNDKEAEKLITQLKKSIVCRWNEFIEQHYEREPFTEEELAPLSEKTAGYYRVGKHIERAYGTTLLAAVKIADFCLIVQLGDGQCVTLKGKEYMSPMPVDEGCLFNQTTSMCDSRAFSEMRHCFFSVVCKGAGGGYNICTEEETACPDVDITAEKAAADGDKSETSRYFAHIPDAVFLCTDGISNSFAEDSNLFDFYYMVTENLRESNGSDEERAQALEELREFINIISKKGSGDDVSLAAVITGVI